MVSLLCIIALIGASSACIRMIPGDDNPGRVCNNCSPARELACPDGSICSFASLQLSRTADGCSRYQCARGALITRIDSALETVSSVVCDRTDQLMWKTRGGELLGRNLRATCAMPCTNCGQLTCVVTPCPQNYNCSVCNEEPFVYTENPGGCRVALRRRGQMFNDGQPITQGVCANGGYFDVSREERFSTASCGLRCDTCPVLTREGLTCPGDSICSAVSIREGQCREAYCPTGTMTANGVEVTSLTCNGQGAWVDAMGTAYTAAQCELMSCQNCTTLGNANIPCPVGLICEAPLERVEECKETYCMMGELRGNPARILLTSLTCNGITQWVDEQNNVYGSAQCEYPCDQCTDLTMGVLMCPVGFVCTSVVTQPGQCPVAACPEGVMRASPGEVVVPSLTCDGNAQWIDNQQNVYTSAQCEDSCTECTPLSNNGMECPQGLLCEAALRREAQCSETYCATGQLTGNVARTELEVLTCNANAQWIDAQSAVYTVAQCETPCDQCPALTNTGMPCLSGLTCTPVMTRNTGQCPESYCETGTMTAGPGRTTVASLSCNGNQQWVDSQSTAYTIAQCEISCVCSPLPITSPPPMMTVRGNDLVMRGDGCSSLGTGCRGSDLLRLVTANGVVTLEPPAGRTSDFTCFDGQWTTDINGVETTVLEQACYEFDCNMCNNVRAGPGVTLTLSYDANTWCTTYALSGCPNGYRAGNTVITSTLTCNDNSRWTSGTFTDPNAGRVNGLGCFCNSTFRCGDICRRQAPPSADRCPRGTSPFGNI